uniref:Uncharacterized protein n=1 Tax=Arundo donax TaxID=35708 RepID=A0A0A9GKZ9_ARUDO
MSEFGFSDGDFSVTVFQFVTPFIKFGCSRLNFIFRTIFSFLLVIVGYVSSPTTYMQSRFFLTTFGL